MSKSTALIPLILACALSLAAQSAWNAPGDTLSVIMQPILNVPEILIPGETLVITAKAPQNTTLWAGALLHGHKRVPLQIFAPLYDAQFGLWTLQAVLPNVAVYELYDLELTASGGIYDVTQNAVQVIPSRKSSYYFVHITDLHLPNRVYYPNAGYGVDSTSVIDFREVIYDINLIRPEFVLLTGDLVNEGELEGLAGQYWYGWTQRLLSLIEVPVYTLAGNHDLGGWNQTPGPQGSSRRNWWRYFGWPWLNTTNSPIDSYTQDYSFRYGDVHYIGLETYINYDDWRYNIYGNNGLIPSQWQWLNLELATDPPTKALFYHYDFEEEFDLGEMGADIALWGHTHRNEGSIYSQPYNLGTRSVCDGNRAYRVIKVNGTNFQPMNTISAGSSGTGIYEYYLPSNEGIADSVQCTIVNNLYIGFDQGLIKFNMPPSANASYTVTGGILEQVDRGGPYNVCYVRVNMMASMTRVVSIKASGVANSDAQAPAAVIRISAYPNPFGQQSTIRVDLPQSRQLSLSVYNLKGQRLRDLSRADLAAGTHTFSWDGKDDGGLDVPNGMYFLRLQAGDKVQIHKIVKAY